MLTALSTLSCVKETSLEGDLNSLTNGLSAFTAYPDSSMTDLDIFMVDSDEYTPVITNLSNSVAIDCNPHWLDDKSAVIYISSSGSQSSLIKTNPFTLESYLFYSSAEPILSISISPAEPKLVYFRTVSNQQSISVNLLDIETSDTISLSTLSNASNLHAAWSLDGRKVAVRAGVILVFDTQQGSLLYTINASGEYFNWDETGDGLYIIRSGDLVYTDTLDEYTILSGENLAYPAFSPDRRSLACVSHHLGNSLIVIDLAFGDYVNVRQVQVPMFECGDYRFVDWSPDGQEISFIDYKEGSWNIFTARRDDFSPIVKVTDDEFVIKALCR